MPLTNKYLKYSPEITLEIFTLIWDKLIENGCKFEYSKEIIFERFKFHKRVLRYESNGNYVYPLTGNNSCKETTVQEILGYDPFIKKEVVPEYVECINIATCNTKVGEIFKCRHSNECFEFEYNDKSKENFNSWDGWSVPWSDELPQKHFKPSTKKAFDAQNKPVEKWSVGSYFVIEKDRLYNISSSTRGDICIIKEDKTFNFINKKDQTNWSFDFREGSRWFATKSEAEEFAKTLVEAVKEEVKQPLKQAVHCTTQEEWDFVTEKLGYKWAQHCSFSAFGKSTCISLIDKQYSYVDYLKNSYQILSFQEWCDLNGYKMKKEVKFEVGKWYKAYYAGKIYFLKYKNTISRNGYNQINYSEFINNGVYKINDSISNTDLENSFKALDDLEEIQQYLPDDHPDKIKYNQEFKVGDWVVITASNKNWTEEMNRYIGDIVKINYISKDLYIRYDNMPNWSFGANDGHFRHATPKEINNHLISIGQIPAGEPLNTGIKPNEDGAFKYTTYFGTTHVGKTSTISGPLKMTLSIDDEELPMVSIIKTNTIKQLLSDD